MKVTREVNVDIGGIEYSISSDDHYLDHIEPGFEPEMVKLFTTVAQDSRVILDIGANIGCTALLFSRLAQQVHAFEPSPTTCQFLERNVARAGASNIAVHNLGLGAESGEYPLTFAPSDRSGGFVSNQTQAGAGHSTESIVIRPLDDIVQSLTLPQIDLIKIDVEGFEGQVLRGATQTLATYRPLVVLELNHWCLNAFQRTSIPDFFDFLETLFPILLAVDGTHYLDLRDATDRYNIMYYHILQMRFPNIVAAFDQTQLATFKQVYHHGFSLEQPEPASQPAPQSRWRNYLSRFNGRMKRLLSGP